MTDDLVTRLRADELPGERQHEREARMSLARLLDEAADEIERLREALHAIVCNTEPSAIKHRDYDHLANAIYVWASAALGEDAPFEDRWDNE